MSIGSAQPALGEAVRTLRQKAGLSQDELAARAELDARSIARLEAGQVDPTWGSMRRIAGGLGVPLEDLAELAETLGGAAARGSIQQDQHGRQ
ncbi:MAG: helix-turn-helix domain-containing protein [Solirubrobacterales bacterium]